MRTRGFGRIVAASMSCASALVIGTATLAQVARPPIFVWNTGGHPIEGGVYADTKDIIAMSRPYNYGGTYDINSNSSAAQAAMEVALDIKRRIASSGFDHIEPGEVCVSLGIWGREMELDCDNAAVRARNVDREGNPLSGDGEWLNSPLRFFVEDDRLPLDLFARGPDVAPAPNMSGDEEAFGFPSLPSARTYYNPVKLANARENGPLRAWTEAFCAMYESIQANPEILDAYEEIELPDPARFYIDKEPLDLIASVGDPNTLHMLAQLINSEQANGLTSQYNYWSNPLHKVPGNDGPSGPRTLKQIYEDEMEPLGFPDADLVLTGTATNRLRPSDAFDSDENRPYMVWYARVCNRARDAAMKNSFYDVVADHWPNCKTSNYQDMDTDGGLGYTGWYMDTDGTSIADAPPGRFVSNTAERSITNFFPTVGGRHWQEVTGLYSRMYAKNSASVNSPVFYRGAASWVFGWAGSGYVTGAEDCIHQPNLYLGPLFPITSTTGLRRIAETADETFMRNFRHELESCIGSSAGAHAKELAPWISIDGLNGQTPAFLRNLLAMLRAHEVPEMIGLSDMGADVSGANQWKFVQGIYNQVFNPYIHTYDITLGESEPSSSAVLPRKLESVRLANGVPETVGIRSEPVSLGGGAAEMTEMIVNFHGLVDDAGHGYFSSSRANSVPAFESGIGGTLTEPGYGYILHLECKLTPTTSGPGQVFYGAIQVYDWNAGNWVSVRIIDPAQDALEMPTAPRPIGPGGGAYGFFTPDRSVRIACDIRPQNYGQNGLPVQDFVNIAGVGVHPAGSLRLRLQHVSLTGDEFISSYDLVQVTPFPFVARYEPDVVDLRPRVVSVHPGPVLTSDDGRHTFTPYSYTLLDAAEFPLGEQYCSMSTFKRTGTSTEVWEPAQLDNPTTIPAHTLDWNEEDDPPNGTWPAGYDVDAALIPNTRILNSRFNLPPSDPLQQRASVRFTLPVWTDAPAESELALQPYTVWYWIARDWRWRDVTEGMVVDISRNPADLNRTITIYNRNGALYQAGFYALTLNTTPPPQPEPVGTLQQKYAVYCSGTLAAPGATIVNNPSGLDPVTHLPVTADFFQYNFRLYPDCNGDGHIDGLTGSGAVPQCNLYDGTGCPADIDNGTGTGYPDGGVDVNDLVYYLYCFEEGQLQGGDLDDGTGTGQPDGGVDINDLLFFLSHFEDGC